MNRFFLLLLILCLPKASYSFTGTAEVNGINYYIITKGNTAEVSQGSYSGEITIPATIDYEGVTCNVVAIGKNAFENCVNLTSVHMSENITSIKDEAFTGCVNLLSVYLSKNVTFIGRNAFYNCKVLNIHITDLSAWCKIKHNFETPYNYAYHLYQNGEEILNLVIPDDVEEIADHAFYGCMYINSVSIPSSVKTIDSYAFAYMKNLNSLEIAEGIKTIEAGAFANNTTLKILRIPQSIKKLGSYCFGNCKELTDVYCYAISLPTMEGVTRRDQFDDCGIEYATLHVPAESLDSYKKTRPWNSFGNIVALTEQETGINPVSITADNSTAIIYNLRGERLNAPQKGINIINGKKIIVK